LSERETDPADAADTRPILIVPYMWIGDFVRGHSAVRLLKSRFPNRPVDMLATPLTAPLADFMPGIRRTIMSDFPRGRLALGKQWEVAQRLRAEHYDTVLVMPRTWKAALAPFLAGIPERIGFVGEARFILLNDLRWGERRIARMIDCMGALTLPAGVPLPKDWPPPQLIVPPAELAAWRAAHGLSGDTQPVVALCPGAVGPGKQWPPKNFAELARRLTAEGIAIWVLGGPHETPIAREIAAAGGTGVRDLTGRDLREAILALAAADTAVANDSGLMHVAAAAGTPPVGLYGPTDPHLYEPLNPVAAQVEPPPGPCPICGRPACPVILHRRVEDIRVDQVLAAVRSALAVANSGHATDVAP
jgi:heptosyltransferase-2